MKFQFLAAIACTSLLMPQCMEAQEIKYPETKTVDHVDEYHGVKVPDRFQWLENDVREDQEVADWVAAQNKVTFSYLEQLPWRKEIEQRVTELWNYEKFSAPSRVGDVYYLTRNDGLQNQDVLYRMDTLESEPVMVLDPNTWSADGTLALGGLSFSDDGRYMAYGIQDGGSDWRTWQIMDTQSGDLLEDKLEWLKFGGITWLPDNSGFYYSRFPEPADGEAFQSTNLNNKVYFHKLGTSQTDDTLIYEDPQHPEWGFAPAVSEDGDYLTISVWKGTDDRNQFYFKALTDEDADFVKMIDDFSNEYSYVGNYGSLFYFQTDLDAPNRKVISIDVNDPQTIHTIIPEAEEALSGVSLVNHTLIADYLKDAKTQIRMFDREGNHLRDVEFPGIGTAGGFGGKKDHTETFYTFSSFATPPSVYRYDMQSGESELIRQAKVDFDPQDYEVRQVFYTSKDGTQVPMFLAHRKGLELNGQNPTLLYGYGGFNISLTPGFSVTRLQWMEMGGVVAVPNLRGGGEYGQKWHKAGTKTHKQNVFDDFIAAAEWLIDNKYTSPEHLAIQGGSNGGLLVGACMTQRPDLFAACLPAVGVMDMLRFQNWTAGRYWVDDYGCSTASKEEFDALYAYSPYHNISDGTSYPATMVTTADTDDRVVPGHSFKFAGAAAGSSPGRKPGVDSHRNPSGTRQWQADIHANRGGGRPVGLPGQTPRFATEL